MDWVVDNQMSIFDYPEACVGMEEAEEFDERKLDRDALIRESLLKGTGTVGGKDRVVQIFTSKMTQKERIQALKKEYGCFGWGMKAEVPYQLCGLQTHTGQYILFYSMPSLEKVAMPVSWEEIDGKLQVLILKGEYKK